MMGLNCRSLSSASPSSSSSSSRNLELENLVSQNVLDESSPSFSSYSTPIVPIEKRLSHQASNGTDMSKSPEELRKEITSLESEILHLERYLLSLYRTAFEEQVPSFSGAKGADLQCTGSGSPSLLVANQFCHKLEQQDQTRCFVYNDQATPLYNKPFSYPQSFYGRLKALSARERTRSVSGRCSLRDLLGATHIVDSQTNPNRLSEEIIRCISSVYCRLSICTRTNLGLSASPPSSVSSSSIFSSKSPYDCWSPHCNEGNMLNQRLEDGHEAIMSHATVIENLKVHLDDDSFNYTALMLQNFRSLVQSLEKVDPSIMKREEKLAFWINIHNALVMHAYLAYGTQNRARTASVLKAAYNVGGHCVNPYIIQSSILGVQPHYSAPLLQVMFSPGRKLKTCSIRHIYALEYLEPLVHFALSSGAFTDPPVRVYTADSIFQDLRQAKEEFIRSNVRIHKGAKILLPKIVYHYAKDMSLDVSEIMEVTTWCLPETQKRIAEKCLNEKKNKCIQWLPENSNFRYVIIGESARGRTKT